jgi:hypothetical protein
MRNECDLSMQPVAMPDSCYIGGMVEHQDGS